jgi:hypothetical protein
VKARLLLISALFVLVQIPAPQAQETLDFTKITCDQFVGDKLTPTNRDIVNWLSGYYHGKHSGTSFKTADDWRPAPSQGYNYEVPPSFRTIRICYAIHSPT